MRYMGAKGKLLEFIEYGLQDSGAFRHSSIFADVFAGTASVGRYFKDKNLDIYSGDIMYMSYVLQRAYIQSSQEVGFSYFGGYEKALEYLDNIQPIQGYVWRNFTTEGTINDEHQRMFFSAENGQKIDAIRTKIEFFKEESFITEDEYFILLATLLESLSFHSNVSGVYAAFLKKYDQRALKSLKMRPIKYGVDGYGKAFLGDGIELIKKQKFDIVYLDPPYNQRQYAPNYHVIETIARWDNPIPRGKAGIREYSDLKSNFCSKSKAIDELERYVREADCNFLALSYNSEGIMSEESIMETFKKYGNVKMYNQQYLRFKSNNNGESSSKKHIEELLFVLEK